MQASRSGRSTAPRQAPDRLVATPTRRGIDSGGLQACKGIAMADVTRRDFLKITSATLAGSSLVLLGFSPTAAVAEVREFKLARATETRNTCPYCAVSCGVLMYSLGDRSKNARSSIFHIEGDPDHPVNRGTLCPKGAGLIDFIHSP